MQNQYFLSKVMKRLVFVGYTWQYCLPSLGVIYKPTVWAIYQPKPNSTAWNYPTGNNKTAIARTNLRFQIDWAECSQSPSWGDDGLSRAAGKIVRDRARVSLPRMLETSLYLEKNTWSTWKGL